MKIIDDIDNISIRNSAVALGKFDGIHNGHKELLKRIVEAKKEGLTSVMLTFSKAPDTILKDSKRQYILTDFEKHYICKKSGLDILVELPLTRELLNMEATEFVKKILINRLGMKKIFAGTDFRFGHNRVGDAVLLKKLASELDFEAIILDKLKFDGREISSSYIKEEIKKGNIELANKLLGYEYAVIGEVVHGNEIGRTINFPTANIIPEADKLLPPNGVYFTKVSVDGVEYAGITNVGVKPTISFTDIRNVETNILDFKGDLYGKILHIRFLMYERPERKFDTIDELKATIAMDAANCVEFLKNLS